MQKKYFIIIVACLLTKLTFGKIIEVGQAKKVKTIQHALTFAASGDTVLVDAGIYREGNIIISTSIVLKGINHPILEGENKYEVLSIKSNNTVVDGFRVQHAGKSSMNDIAGIKIYDGHGVTIINNIL